MGSSGVEKRISTDILIIGGGLAGCFTAIKAREHGVKVTLVDKGYVGKTSGIQPFPGDLQVFDPARGHKFEEWINQIRQGGEYLNHQDWSETVLKESLDRFKDIVSWGIEFSKTDGDLTTHRMGVMEHFSMVSGQFLPALRRKAQDSGVKIMDRVMACELLKHDGKVAGAIGFHTASGDLYVIQAKAVVIATGSSSLKLGQKPINYWTADGEAMAYRAGAEITGKEFTVAGMMAQRSDVKSPEKAGKAPGGTWKEVDSLARFPRFGYALMSPVHPDFNAEGGHVINPNWEAHSGRIPLYGYVENLNPRQQNYIEHVYRDPETSEILKSGKLRFKMGTIDDLVNVFGGSGIWPVNMECASGLPGLYAVGNACATRASGTTYPGLGFGLCHCSVTGNRAARSAADYARKSKTVKLDERELNRLKKIVSAPVERVGGFSPGWVTQLVQSITVPYFVLQIKREDRLKAALTQIEFVNSQIVPEIMAKDAHEWRMAQEARNMALDAEMRLRASLFRKESRGTHFREDYPRRDDPAWLAWVKVKRNKQGQMKVTKEPIPEKWWPDLSEPYEKRYPRWFPGE
jgi:succinate dehydrogenase/fumarate reductase flavoprotein subunit